MSLGSCRFLDQNAHFWLVGATSSRNCKTSPGQSDIGISEPSWWVHASARKSGRLDLVLTTLTTLPWPSRSTVRRPPSVALCVLSVLCLKRLVIAGRHVLFTNDGQVRSAVQLRCVRWRDEWAEAEWPSLCSILSLAAISMCLGNEKWEVFKSVQKCSGAKTNQNVSYNEAFIFGSMVSFELNIFSSKNLDCIRFICRHT